VRRWLVVVLALGGSGCAGSQTWSCGTEVLTQREDAYQTAARRELARARCPDGESLQVETQIDGARSGRVGAFGCGHAFVLDCACTEPGGDECRWAACIVTCEGATLLPIEPQPPPPATGEHTARELDALGQEHHARGDYVASARAYAQILDMLPEAAPNRAERENTVLIATAVYREALEAAPDATARRQLLAEALGLHERYAAEHQRVYLTDVSVEITESARQLTETPVTPDGSIAAELRCEGGVTNAPQASARVFPVLEAQAGWPRKHVGPIRRLAIGDTTDGAPTRWHTFRARADAPLGPGRLGDRDATFTVVKLADIVATGR
jgi:hypothetical protein